jgi:hypothetical protein
MKSPAEHVTIQIELTSACVKRCSNCTRFSGTKQRESFITEENFKKAIDSLVEYSKQPHALVGFMGGESLLHPAFPEFCEYALAKIGREKLGLWSTFPDAPKYIGYREIICKTFSCVLLNDHSRDDILHAPVLMASEEYFQVTCNTCGGLPAHSPDEVCPTCQGKGTVTDDRALFLATEHCWIQERWSSSINNKGAWFCEVAAALADLFDGPDGWDVEAGWWRRTPMDFKEQREWACKKCGAALPLERVRNSQDNRDDVSPGNLERLKAIKSRKVAKGEYEVRDKFVFDRALIENGTYPRQTYQDEMYRRGIAARYGIELVMNKRGYWEPVLMKGDWRNQQAPMPAPPPPSLYQIMSSQG